MKISKFFPPYFKKGDLLKCTLNNSFQKSAGVYFIRQGQEIVYIGYSSNNLYKTIYRHFETHNDKKQDRIVYPKIGLTIRIIKTTKNQASRLEKYLIKKFKPKNNELLYEDTDAEKFYISEMKALTGEEIYSEEVPF